MSVPVAASDRSSCPQCLAVFRGGFRRCPRDGAILSSEDRDPLVGTVLAERYVIESVIGEGGIGRVYRARHVRMSRRYAIKVPFGELAYDSKVRTRFLHEAEATSRLAHPSVIGVVDVGETPAGLLYLAMDLAEGVALAEELHHVGPLPRERVVRIARQIAEGLGHAHDRGLVHRDLKPENVILVADDGGADRVRIVDFGIAILRDAEGNSGRLTTEGMVLGTPHYMAPEQACNLEIDHRTDLFALGLILYEMLAGVLPFEGTPVEVARKNLGAEPPRIDARVPGLAVDPLLEALAFWLLEKRPEARPQGAAEVVELLDRIEADPAAAAAALGLGEVADRAGDATPAEPPPAGPADAAAPAPVAPGATSPEAGGRRRALLLGLGAALAALLAVVALVARGRDDGGAAGAAAPVDASPRAERAVLVDAGVEAVAADAASEHAEAAGPDAGAAPIAAAAPAREPRAGSGRRPRREAAASAGAAAGSATAATAADPLGSGEPPSSASFKQLYDQVGRRLAALTADRGDRATAALARRYQAIHYLEASRKPDLRAEAMAELRALARELAALP
jgi:eukaryotic-like serine/threonine-protein kinase